MRIVFFGATEFGYQCCKQLLEIGEEVVGIFSIPREFRISYSPTPVRNVTFRSFEDLADAYDIPLVHVTSKMSDAAYLDTVREWQPDFGLAIGWYYIIPGVMRDAFPQGVAGIHASLLPQYRGGAPLVWAIIRGETQTGVTLFYFDGGVDTGDVIARQPIAISPDDTIKTVYDRAVDASRTLLARYVPLIRTRSAPRIPQDHSAATTFPQRKPADGLIDWHEMTARQVCDWVRAQTRPYPGAFTYYGNDKVTIWSARPGTLVNTKTTPGQILPTIPEHPDVFGVWTRHGRLLHIHEVEVAGERAMTGADFIASYFDLQVPFFASMVTNEHLL